jgi:hypothetical protein
MRSALREPHHVSGYVIGRPINALQGVHGFHLRLPIKHCEVAPSAGRNVMFFYTVHDDLGSIFSS